MSIKDDTVNEIQNINPLRSIIQPIFTLLDYIQNTLEGENDA